MKKLIVLSLPVLFMFIQSASAKIWRVNNVPGITANFTSAQAAHNGASAGDTIYLESSSNSYGDVIVNKKLVWISLGYFLTENPGLQYHTNTGFINSLTVNGGADSSTFSIAATGGIYVNSVTNLTFKRCYVNTIFSISGNSNHITINGCYMNFNNYLNIDPATPQLSFTVINNIFNAPILYIRPNAYQVTFNNNTFNQSPPNYSVLQIDNATISNNIFINCLNGIYYDAGYPSNLNYNTWVGTTNSNYVGSNNNTFSANFTDVFVGGSSTDAKYKLSPTSPAIGSGAGGIDRGAYGGGDPYVVSQIPAIPSIYQLTVPANATGNSLPCSVSTRANN